MSYARLTPQEREGVRRFMADYRASTRYRVWVKVKGYFEPHSSLPTFGTWTEAELAAARIAGPTEVRAEKSEPEPQVADESDWGAVERQSVESTVTDGGKKANATAPQPLFCQCGHSEDEHYLGSVCQKVEGFYVCGCDKFIVELDAESYRKSLAPDRDAA